MSENNIGLSPPAVVRNRANSASRQPLQPSSILCSGSIGRRASNNLLQAFQLELEVVPPTPTSTPPPLTLQEPPSSSMLYVFASRLFHWMQNVQPMHPWSTPSSPRSSTEDFELPLSAPAHRLNFEDVLLEKPSEKSPSSSKLRLHLSSAHFPILVVLLLLPISTALVVLALHTLPISVSWPKTLADLAQLGRELHGYSQSGPWPMAHVVGVMAITAVWKHAWSIPGSVIWNVLAGALFSPSFATILMSVLTMLGSAGASMLSKPLAPFLTQMFPRALDMTRHALEGDNAKSDILGPDAQTTAQSERSSAWVRLSVLRLIGVVPWSGINIACGVCGVAITDCMLGAFIGTLPWTAVTCQIGDILQTVASAPSPTPQTISSLLASPEIILKLAFLSFLSLAPILGRDKLRTLISHSASPEASRENAGEENSTIASRWSWVQEWRSKIRRSTPRVDIPSRSEDQRVLEVLIQEKGRGVEDLPL